MDHQHTNRTDYKERIGGDSSGDEGQRNDSDSEDEVNNEYFVNRKQRKDSFESEEDQNKRDDEDDYFKQGRAAAGKPTTSQGLQVDETGFAIVNQSNSNLNVSQKDKKSAR